MHLGHIKFFFLQVNITLSTHIILISIIHFTIIRILWLLWCWLIILPGQCCEKLHFQTDYHFLSLLVRKPEKLNLMILFFYSAANKWRVFTWVTISTEAGTDENELTDIQFEPNRSAETKQPNSWTSESVKRKEMSFILLYDWINKKQDITMR